MDHEVEDGASGPGDPEPGFVGRAAELGLLEDAWRRRESAFIPIYGRRRIGKSELILHFLRGKQAIYHVGKVAPAGLANITPKMMNVSDEPMKPLTNPLNVPPIQPPP